MDEVMKKVVIIGATSGIGKEIAMLYLQKGCQVAIAGRRESLLKELHHQYPQQIVYQVIDTTQTDAVDKLDELIGRLGGMDLFIHCAGIGKQNPQLELQTEIDTARTNVEGFTRMVDTAFRYFEKNKGGHIAAISSIAGTKGLGMAPAYSATKRFQNTYIESLEQLATLRKLPIRFTDIRPGFVATDFLKDQHYPLLMSPKKVAQTIVKGIDRHKHILTIDWKYRLLVACWRWIPRCLWRNLPIHN